ncbi:hypothetical protein ACLOJK_033953 [Asimina triloba]
MMEMSTIASENQKLTIIDLPKKQEHLSRISLLLNDDAGIKYLQDRASAKSLPAAASCRSGAELSNNSS